MDYTNYLPKDHNRKHIQVEDVQVADLSGGSVPPKLGRFPLAYPQCRLRHFPVSPHCELRSIIIRQLAWNTPRSSLQSPFNNNRLIKLTGNPPANDDNVLQTCVRHIFKPITRKPALVISGHPLGILPSPPPPLRINLNFSARYHFGKRCILRKDLPRFLVRMRVGIG